MPMGDVNRTFRRIRSRYMISESERCRIAVRELQREAEKYNGAIIPKHFEKIAKKAKLEPKTLYQYIKVNDIII